MPLPPPSAASPVVANLSAALTSVRVIRPFLADDDDSDKISARAQPLGFAFFKMGRGEGGGRRLTSKIKCWSKEHIYDPKKHRETKELLLEKNIDWFLTILQYHTHNIIDALDALIDRFLGVDEGFQTSKLGKAQINSISVWAILLVLLSLSSSSTRFSLQWSHDSLLLLPPQSPMVPAFNL